MWAMGGGGLNRANERFLASGKAGPVPERNADYATQNTLYLNDLGQYAVKLTD